MLPTILILAVIAAAVMLAIRSIRRTKQSGGGCGCGCDGCSAGCHGCAPEQKTAK